MTIKQTSDAVAVTGAGTFERIVSHDEALEAAKALIDGHFNNKGGRGVYISIPAQPDNTDVLLVDYIKQQRALSRLASTPAVSTDELVAVLEEGNRRGLYDTTKIGPELVAFLDDRGGMLAALRDEMSEGYRGWLDDAVGALQIARDHLAALTTPAPAVSTDDAIEQIVVGFSDKAILRLDIEEDDPRLSRVCDDMRQTVRAILSRLRGEGE